MKRDNTLILSPEQSAVLFRTSFLCLLSLFYGVIKGHYDLAIIGPGGVFITSVNYWRRPDYSWRRYADITYVHFALFYELARTYDAEYRGPYYLLVILSLILFAGAVTCYDINYVWLSVYLHASLHVTANAANLILFSGTIEPWSDQILYNTLYELCRHRNHIL